MAKIVCRDCGTIFERPKRRGRPPVRCVEGCKPKETLKTVPVPDLEVKSKDGWKLARGHWVRVKKPSTMVPGHVISFTGPIVDILKEPSGRVLLLVKEKDVEYERPAEPRFCKRRKPPKKRKTLDERSWKEAPKRKGRGRTWAKPKLVVRKKA